MALLDVQKQELLERALGHIVGDALEGPPVVLVMHPHVRHLLQAQILLYLKPAWR